MKAASLWNSIAILYAKWSLNQISFSDGRSLLASALISSRDRFLRTCMAISSYCLIRLPLSRMMWSEM